MIKRSKFVYIILCWALVAFGVSTVVLGIQHSQLTADIKDAQEKLDYMETQLLGEIKPRHKRSTDLDNADDDKVCIILIINNDLFYGYKYEGNI